MKITFTGTGTSQGVPVIGCACDVCRSKDFRDNRLRTSALIESEGKKILIDAGPDLRQQLLKANVNSLDGILITHEHRDHVGGLDEVRALNYFQQKPADVYAEAGVLKAIRADFAYAFQKIPYPGAPKIDLHEFSENEPFRVAGIRITPIRVIHMNLPVSGFRIGDLTYITDASSIPEEEFEKIYGTKLLVLNALRKEKHISHFTLYESIDIAKRIGAETTVFTHISHQMGLYADVKKELPAGMILAYDTLQINV